MIKIVTDSTCDLPKELLEEYKIETFPLLVTLGEDVFYDGVDIKADDIFGYVEKTGTLPKTSARNIYDLKEIFEKFTENGDTIIYCGIGSKLSSNFSSAVLAREEMEHKERVYLVDSCNLSTGISVALIEGAKALANLKNPEEIVSIMEHTTKHISGSFIVDKLDYLYKGGRVSKFSFSVASFLKIRPRLEVVDGVLLNTGKEMGTYKGVVKKYIDYMLSKYKNIRKDVVYVTHSKADKENLDYFMEYLKSKNIFEKIVDCDAGSVITSHCGPNTIGMFFMFDMEE